MACACKVNQDLSYLQKHYGVGKEQEGSKKSNIRDRVKNLPKRVLIALICLVFAPIFLVAILWRITVKKENVINVSKIFKLGYVGKQ